jgi:hypothetical protein
MGHCPSGRYRISTTAARAATATPAPIPEHKNPAFWLPGAIHNARRFSASIAGHLRNEFALRESVQLPFRDVELCHSDVLGVMALAVSIEGMV